MKSLLRLLLIVICVVTAIVVLAAIVFRDRRPPLYFAIERGDTNYVARYLASGGDVNDRIPCFHVTGFSAPLLDVAIANSQLGTIDFLLKHGANPNEADTIGCTPLRWTISGRGIPSSEIRVQIVKAILRAGADPNLKDSSESQNTPLIIAASDTQLEMVHVLLDAGANVNGTNSLGETALHHTFSPEVAAALLSAGANPEARSDNLMTPINIAWRDRNFELLSVLTNKLARTNFPAR